VQHRWLTIGATVLVFVLGLAGMGKVQQQFFPDSSRPEVLVDIWSRGHFLQANKEVTLRVESALQLEGVESVSEWIGSGAPRFYLPLDQVFPQNNVSQFILVAKDLKAREEIRKQLPALMAEIPRGAGRAQAAAQRAARALSGAVPSGSMRCCAPTPTKSRRSCRPTPICAA
jgi:multidrug efflux pump subunit AcrB